MTKQNNKWKSLSGLLKNLKAKAKQILLTKEVVPDDVANDPRAIMEWMRGERKREKRRRKWR